VHGPSWLLPGFKEMLELAASFGVTSSVLALVCSERFFFLSTFLRIWGNVSLSEVSDKKMKYTLFRGDLFSRVAMPF